MQTKRLLGLSYLWVGGSNGIQIQLYATWILYAVLADLCQQVATKLQVPLGRISVEMVFRSLYHVSRAFERDKATDLVGYLCDNAKLLSLVKPIRKRHRANQAEHERIWAQALT